MGGAYNPSCGGAIEALLGQTDNAAFRGCRQHPGRQAGRRHHPAIRRGGVRLRAPIPAPLPTRWATSATAWSPTTGISNNQMQRALLGDITGVEQMGVQNQMAGLGAAPGAWDFGLAE